MSCYPSSGFNSLTLHEEEKKIKIKPLIIQHNASCLFKPLLCYYSPLLMNLCLFHFIYFSMCFIAGNQQVVHRKNPSTSMSINCLMQTMSECFKVLKPTVWMYHKNFWGGYRPQSRTESSRIHRTGSNLTCNYRSLRVKIHHRFVISQAQNN